MIHVVLKGIVFQVDVSCKRYNHKVDTKLETVNRKTGALGIQTQLCL